MLLRERQTPDGLLVSVCDRDLLGETFEDGDVSLTVTEEFYDGEPVDSEAVVDALSRAAVANLVGTRAVAVAIDAGYVKETNVLDIEDTPHAQFMRL